LAQGNDSWAAYKFQECYSDFNKCFKGPPENVNLRLLLILGDLCITTKAEEACDIFAKAREIVGDDPQIVFKQGIASCQKGNEDCFEFFNAAQNLDPSLTSECELWKDKYKEKAKEDT